MKRVQVLKQKLPYGRLFHAVGSVIDMPEEHARLLSIVGRVSVLNDAAEPVKKKRRVYKRRVAKPVETAVIIPEEPEMPEPIVEETEPEAIVTESPEADDE